MLKKNKNTIILTNIIILLPILVGIILWDRLPDTMATHFGIDNEANGFSSKLFAVVGQPVFLSIIQIFCAVVTAKDPKKQNISKKVYTLVLWLVPCLSIFTSGQIYTYNLGIKMDISLFASVFVGLIFVITGNYMPKARQNYTIGIKLPWTLANEENWNKTHRFAGVIWIIAGIVLMLVPFIGILNNERVMIGVVIIATMMPSVYSFVLHTRKGL